MRLVAAAVMCRSLFLTFLAVVPAVFAALPSGWKACSMSAADYDACFLKEVTNALTTLYDGNKKLGVFPLDPLRIDTIIIPKHDGPVSVSLEFKGVEVSGLKDLKLLSLKNDWKKVAGSAHVPHLTAIANYKVDGKVLVLPITGEGPCNITFHDLSLDLDVDWKQIENKGKKYFQMDKFKLALKPKRLYLQLDNLFNGDKALGDNMNVFINENWQEILKELSPPISDGLSQALVQISNRVLSKIPAEEIDLK